MEFRQLKYFIEVAEREHVSEAAHHLHVAQSAISRQIANLENELGVQLFERQGRNVKLLPIGKIFLVHAREAMKAIDFAKRQMDEYIDPERGSIKIGFPTSLASTMLPHLLAEFKAQYPYIHFQLRQGTYSFLIDAIKDRELDLAFIGPVITDDPQINGDVLFHEQMFLLAPRNHRLANRKSVYLTELKDEEFVLFPKGYIFEKLVTDACQSVGFDPLVSTEGEDMDAIKGMVAAGIGVTILPESALHEQSSNFSVIIPISSPDLKRSVGMITPKHRPLAPSEKVFYDFVLRQFNYQQNNNDDNDL